MKSHFSYLQVSWVYRVLSIFGAALAAALISGCGGSNAANTSPTPAGNTLVTVVASSTANDKLTEFDLSFNTITLTSQSGKAVSLLPAIEHAEFIHLNGGVQPLFTVSVPEDIYTSATATIGPADFVCLGTLSDGKNRAEEAAYGYTPDSHVKVTLPKSITLSGTSMILSLDLQVSQSASWNPTECTTLSSFAITPTFNLTPASSQLASVATANMHGLAGLIASIDSARSSFVVNAADGPATGLDHINGDSATWKGPVWKVVANSNAVFQGVAGFSALTAGMPVDMDASLQGDGSLLATRIAVADTNTSTLSIFAGPLTRIDSSDPILLGAGTEQYGYLRNTIGTYLGGGSFSLGGATFYISGEISNLQQLPFAARFDESTMASGQAISITTHATDDQPYPVYFPATTVTLLPQTINGTVQSISSIGEFGTYTVALASYDLFPQFAAELFQSTVLTDPATIVVYADRKARLLNTQPIAVGNVVRFHGVVFNDQGVLRMDCLQSDDGVAE
jgi:hypothetical protein